MQQRLMCAVSLVLVLAAAANVPALRVVLAGTPPGPDPRQLDAFRSAEVALGSASMVLFHSEIDAARNRRTRYRLAQYALVPRALQIVSPRHLLARRRDLVATPPLLYEAAANRNAVLLRAELQRRHPQVQIEMTRVEKNLFVIRGLPPER